MPLSGDLAAVRDPHCDDAGCDGDEADVADGLCTAKHGGADEYEQDPHGDHEDAFIFSHVRMVDRREVP